MLLLRAKTATINNITFFADDTDEDQFWYLPGDIHLAERDGKPIFSLIKYTGDAEHQQGGYINFEVNTKINEDELNHAFSEYLRKMSIDNKNARKAQVPYDKGVVNFVVLDAKNTNSLLISSQSPSLVADNSAIFSAKLTPEQTVILQAAFNQAQAPVGVVYNLTYTGITPALKVNVQAKFENIYKQFDIKFGANIPIPTEPPATFWLGFDSVIKKLIQNQDLIITVSESLPSTEAEKEKTWALEWVKEEILKSFFSATLKPNENANPQAKTTSESLLEMLLTGTKDKDAQKSTLIPCGSLELKLQRLQEIKTLNFNYSSAKAITQSATPQNFIGNEKLRVKKEPPYYIEVNVNDPFFQKTDLLVFGPDGFTERQLKSASVSIGYNNNYYTSPSFEGDNGKWEKQIARSQNPHELFEVQANFIFKSASLSGYEGNSTYQYARQISPQIIYLDPADILTFNSIKIMPIKQLKWENYEQITVTLNYQDDNQRQRTKQYDFCQEQAAPQYFKYRCLTDKPWEIKYIITWYRLDGTSSTTQGRINASMLPVGDAQ
ncbi:TPA: hypothetical protein MYO83_005423 [Klebsiella michiganensis]|nr:hypothetical protein [Klebsiella michiganensis]HCB1848935.1 hypothetical protein [Klebsiella oxytoca]